VKGGYGIYPTTSPITNTGPALYYSSMRFCPLCGNLLLIENEAGCMRFCCPTCPYIHNLDRNYSTHVKLKKKAVDDVLGGKEAWDNVDKTRTRCPFCSNDTAYYQMRQIRSADEPSTIFYKCCRCMQQWNDL
jgi:DNA-directed RNA polymerase III subunit RPC11